MTLNPEHRSYEELSGGFTWAVAEKELEYKNGNVINIGWYCSDRICLKGNASKIALIYEGFGGIGRQFTYNDIRLAGNTIGSFLRGLGITQGDRVCLFMDRIPELYLSFLGILKMGAIVQPLFSAFGEESLFVRLENAGTRAIITQKKHLGKVRKIRKQLTDLEFVIIVDDMKPADLAPGEVLFSLDRAEPVEQFDICPTHAETPSVLHYTSGTTGQPKGVRHVHYSLISQYLTTKWVLDLRDDDIYWCTADPGWVTGTSYGIIGPWSLGVTQCVLDSGFSAQAWYRFAEKNRVTVWYSAPTAIRSLMKAGDEIVKSFDLSSLRHLASVGEPLNSEAVIWSEKVFGKPFHDTFWQTETGSIMITNFPGMKIKPGSMGRTFPGITGTVLDPATYQPYPEHGQAGL
ncbi:MAG: AMP-binding protein, partial [Bacteroidota bacterium]|nr:AMP-binding protein [Bacteroidota bacterium]